MQKKDHLANISKENNGILRTKDAADIGISRTYFQEFVRKEGYEQVARGIYLSPDAWEDGMYILQIRFEQAVFSHETALYLLDLADREPTQYTVTVKQGYNPEKLSRQGVKAYTVKKEWHSLGIIEVQSPMGHTVRTYNAERTLCDIFRSHSQVEIQDKKVAIKEYVKQNKKDIPLLMDYAKIFKVDKMIKQYLEVLL